MSKALPIIAVASGVCGVTANAIAGEWQAVLWAFGATVWAANYYVAEGDR